MKKQIKNALPVVQNPSLVAVRGSNDETSLSQYIQNIQKFPILSAEQEYEYAKKWTESHDSDAAEKLVASHLRMVVSVAYDFKNYGVPFADLIASGNMGLMQALQKFDPDKGFRFSTYAMFWIRAEIYETILQKWSIVKIGTSANHFTKLVDCENWHICKSKARVFWIKSGAACAGDNGRKLIR